MKNLIAKIKIKIKDLGKFTLAVLDHFVQDQGAVVASSMAFYTLLSVVPFIAFFAIALSYFKVIDINYAIELFDTKIVQPFFPSHQNEIANYLNKILKNAPTFGYIGFFSFLFASSSLLGKISSSFNWIYSTRPHINFFARIGTFLLLLVGFVIMLALTLVFIVPTVDLLNSIGVVSDSSIFAKLSSKTTPWVSLFIGLFLMIKLIPATKVKFKSAIIGAAFGTITWQLANYLFIKGISSSLKYEKLYGSLASIVICLVWINIIWVIIYFALEITYVHQYKTHLYAARNQEIYNPYNTFANSLAILATISEGEKRQSEFEPKATKWHFNFFGAQHKTKQQKGLTIFEIGKQLLLPERELNYQLKRLEKSKIVIKSRRFPFKYSLAKPASSLELSEVLSAIYGKEVYRGGRHTEKGQTLSEEILNSLLQQFEAFKADRFF